MGHLNTLHSLVAIATMLLVMGCDPAKVFAPEEAFAVKNTSHTVTDEGGFTRISFEVDVVGFEHGSEGGEYKASFDMTFDVEAPGGRKVTLSDNSMHWETTQASRIYQVTLAPYFDLPREAPKGEYTVSLTVIDSIGKQKLNEVAKVQVE